MPTPIKLSGNYLLDRQAIERVLNILMGLTEAFMLDIKRLDNNQRKVITKIGGIDAEPKIVNPASA